MVEKVPYVSKLLQMAACGGQQLLKDVSMMVLFVVAVGL